ncbi:MAG: hypothetical protein Q4D79_14260 [Propionibacteriaceae bacterium]|nr:hypothetical protein [Propionibacteriaceae bacterium]
MVNIATRVALAAIALVTVGVAGVAIGAVFFADDIPKALETPLEISTVPVTQRTFADPRPVQISLKPGSEADLVAPAGGRLTRFDCQPGGAFVSGKSNAVLDGLPVVNLATSVPLWRDLAVGDRGEDVTALNAELRRLGFDEVSGDVVTASTVQAVSRLLADAGGTGDMGSSITVSRLLWLPEAETTVATCATQQGSQIETGTALAALPRSLDGATLTSVPSDIAPGERLVLVDSIPIPVSGDGAVTDLSALAQTPSYEQAIRAENYSVTASYVLATPPTVWVVPPSSLYSFEGTAACLAAQPQPLPVQVVGSELGQSFVTFEAGDPPTEALLQANENQPCR